MSRLFIISGKEAAAREGTMPKEYVELRDGGRWIAGTRVSLDSVVVAFREGLSPETIAAECFPSLSLEEVYGAITYYLAHRQEIDAALAAADEEFEALHRAQREAEPEFYRRLAAARAGLAKLSGPGLGHSLQ